MSQQIIDFSNIKNQGTVKIPPYFKQGTPDLKIAVKTSQNIGDDFIASALYKTTQMDNSVSTNTLSLTTEENFIDGNSFGNLNNTVESIVFFTSPDNVINGQIIISTN